MASAGQLMVEIGANVARLRSDMAQATKIVRGTADQMSSALRSVGGALAAGFAGFSAAQVAKDIATTGIEVERLGQAFKAITGSVAGAMSELDFVRNLANTLGQDFMSLADGFKGISAAAKGTSLEGEQVRRVFESVVKYGTSLQLSNDQVKGSLLALSQMISKGTASMEEIRQQLGERMPGALQAMARAMGVSTEQFVEMVSKGEVLSAELLPKFAEELDKLSGKSESAAASFNRLQNEWNALKSNIWEGGAKSVFSTMADELTRVIKLLNEAPDRLAQFGSTFANTLNLTEATKAANMYLRPETAEHYAGIGGGVEGPSPASSTGTAIEVVEKYWKTYREGAQKAVSSASQMIADMQKKELTGLQSMLQEALKARKDYQTQVNSLDTAISQNKQTGQDMINNLKRSQMSPQEQQASLTAESKKKLTDAYFAMWGGDTDKAKDLAEQSRQVASGLDDVTTATQGVQAATKLLDRIYQEQRDTAVEGMKEQEKAIGELKSQIESKAVSPVQDLVTQLQAAQAALGQMGQTEFEITGIDAVVTQLESVQSKLEQINSELQKSKELNVDVTMTHSPKTSFTQGYNQILDMLNSLPTGSNYNMNFSFGISNALNGKGNYSESNRQYYELMDMRDQVVSTLRNFGISISDSIDIFNEYASGAWDRMNYAMRKQENALESVSVFKDAGNYMLDQMQYFFSQDQGELYGSIASAIENASSGSPYDSSSYESHAEELMGTTASIDETLQRLVDAELAKGSEGDPMGAISAYYGYGNSGSSMSGSSSSGGVVVERAVDVGNIIVNLGGSSVDAGLATAEEIDAQLAELVSSNRSKLRGAIKDTWSN